MHPCNASRVSTYFTTNTPHKHLDTSCMDTSFSCNFTNRKDTLTQPWGGLASANLSSACQTASKIIIRIYRNTSFAWRYLTSKYAELWPSRQSSAALNSSVHTRLDTQRAGNCRCVRQVSEDIIWQRSAELLPLKLRCQSSGKSPVIAKQVSCPRCVGKKASWCIVQWRLVVKFTAYN